MAYITAAAFKTYRDIDQEDDDLISDLINQAQKVIERQTGRVFEQPGADETRYFDAENDVDEETLWLDDDLLTITTITNGDATTVASDEYVTEPRNETPIYAIRLLASSGVAWTYTTDPENAISIAGKWAYSTTPPDDIVLAMLRLTKWFYDQRQSTEADQPSVSPSGMMLLPGTIPRDVMTLLTPYKKGL